MSTNETDKNKVSPGLRSGALVAVPLLLLLGLGFVLFGRGGEPVSNVASLAQAGSSQFS